MLSEKEQLEQRFKKEIEECQNEIEFRTKLINMYEDIIQSLTIQNTTFEERIEILQKLLLALGED